MFYFKLFWASLAVARLWKNFAHIFFFFTKKMIERKLGEMSLSKIAKVRAVLSCTHTHTHIHLYLFIYAYISVSFILQGIPALLKENFFFLFSYLCMVKYELFLDQIFEMEILIDLHALKSSES